MLPEPHFSLSSLGAPLLELEASRAFGSNRRLRRCPKENTFHTLHWPREYGHIVVLYPMISYYIIGSVKRHYFEKLNVIDKSAVGMESTQAAAVGG